MPTPSPAADLNASAQLAALLELLDDGVVLLDASHRVTHANTAFVTLCGVGVAPHMLLTTPMPAGPATFRSAYQEPGVAAEHFERALAGGRTIRDQRHTMTGGRVVSHDYLPITVAAATVGHLWVLRDLARRDATSTAPPQTAPDTTGRRLTSPDAAPTTGHRRTSPDAAAATTGHRSTSPDAAAATTGHRSTSPDAEPATTGHRSTSADAELAATRHRLAAAVAHELRTPATSVAAFAGLLTDPDADTDARQRAVAAIDRNAARLQLLAADLLLLAELDAPAAVPFDTLVDLPALVGRVLAESHPCVAAQTEPGPPVTGDEELLRQAISTVVAVIVSLATESNDNSPHDTAPPDTAPPGTSPLDTAPPDAAPPDTASRADSPGDGTGPQARVRAAHSIDGWTITATAPVACPVTPERLFAIQVPHPADAEATRTAPLALLLASAIVVRHGGGFSSVGSAAAHTITLRLPSS